MNSKITSFLLILYVTSLCNGKTDDGSKKDVDGGEKNADGVKKNDDGVEKNDDGIDKTVDGVDKTERLVIKPKKCKGKPSGNKYTKEANENFDKEEDCHDEDEIVEEAIADGEIDHPSGGDPKTQFNPADVMKVTSMMEEMSQKTGESYAQMLRAAAVDLIRVNEKLVKVEENSTRKLAEIFDGDAKKSAEVADRLKPIFDEARKDVGELIKFVRAEEVALESRKRSRGGEAVDVHGMMEEMKVGFVDVGNLGERVVAILADLPVRLERALKPRIADVGAVLKEVSDDLGVILDDVETYVREILIAACNSFAKDVDNRNKVLNTAIQMLKSMGMLMGDFGM